MKYPRKQASAKIINTSPTSSRTSGSVRSQRKTSTDTSRRYATADLGNNVTGTKMGGADNGTTTKQRYNDLPNDGKIHSDVAHQVFMEKVFNRSLKHIQIYEKTARENTCFCVELKMPAPMCVSDSVKQIVFSSLCWFLMLYTLLLFIIFLGVILFQISEKPEEDRVNEEYRTERKKVFFALYKWNKSESEEDSDAKLIQGITTYLTALRRLNTHHGFDARFGTQRNAVRQWSTSGCLLYMSSLLSTVGYYGLTVGATASKVQNIFFLLLGLPVHLLLLTHAGFLLSTAITLLLRVAIPRFWWRYIRRTSMDDSAADCVITVDKHDLHKPSFCDTKSQLSRLASPGEESDIDTSLPVYAENRTKRMTLLNEIRVRNLHTSVSCQKYKHRKKVSVLPEPIHTPVGLLTPNIFDKTMVLHAGQYMSYYVELVEGKNSMNLCAIKNCHLCKVTTTEELLMKETLRIFEYRIPELLVTVLLLVLYEFSFASYIYLTSDNYQFTDALYFTMATLSTFGCHSFQIPTYENPRRYRVLPVMMFLHFGLVIVAACFQPKPRPSSIIVIGNVMDRIPDLRPAFIMDYVKQRRTPRYGWERYVLKHY